MNTVAEGIESGEFRKAIPVEITGMAILGMVNWTYMWYQQSGEKSIDEIGKIYVDLILHEVLNNKLRPYEKYETFILDEQIFFLLLHIHYIIITISWSYT